MCAVGGAGGEFDREMARASTHRESAGQKRRAGRSQLHRNSELVTMHALTLSFLCMAHACRSNAAMSRPRPSSALSGSNAVAPSNSRGFIAPPTAHESSSSSSSSLRASASSEKFSSLMNLIHNAEEKTEMDGQALQASRNFAASAGSTATNQTRSYQPSSSPSQPRGSGVRPLSAAALISPRSSVGLDSPARSSSRSNTAVGAASAGPGSAKHPPRTLQVNSAAAVASPSSSSSPYSARFDSPSPSPSAAKGASTGFASPSPRANIHTAAPAASTGLPASSPALSKPASYSMHHNQPSSAVSTGIGGATVGAGGFDSLKTKVANFKADLAAKDSTIASLRAQIQSLQLDLTSQTQRHTDSLASQKAEYETLLASSQNFVEKVLNEKAALNGQVSSLAEQIANLSASYAAKETEFRSTTLAAEIAKAKSLWIAAEKVSRDNFLAHRTKQIKTETLASMEPEVKKLLARTAQEKKDMEEALARKHQTEIANLRQDHEALIASIRKQHGVALDHAREEERALSQKRLRESVEKFDSMMQDQRAKHLAELDAERARASTNSASLQAAIEKALLQQRQEHLVAISRLKDQAAQDVEDRDRRAALQLSSERERLAIEKESWSGIMLAKLQKDAADKLAQHRAALKTEHDEEISMLVQKITSEAEKQTKDVVREYERKLDVARKGAQGDIAATKRSADEWQTKHTALLSAHSALESQHRSCASNLASLQSDLAEKSEALRDTQERLAHAEKKIATVQKDTMDKVSHGTTVAEELGC